MTRWCAIGVETIVFPQDQIGLHRVDNEGFSINRGIRTSGCLQKNTRRHGGLRNRGGAHAPHNERICPGLAVGHQRSTGRRQGLRAGISVYRDWNRERRHIAESKVGECDFARVGGRPSDARGIVSAQKPGQMHLIGELLHGEAPVFDLIPCFVQLLAGLAIGHQQCRQAQQNKHADGNGDHQLDQRKSTLLEHRPPHWESLTR